MATPRPTTEEGVANLVLDKCHQDEIATLDDDAARARAVKRHFGQVRDSMLRDYDWNFATRWAVPAADPLPHDGNFSIRYVMPADCLRVRSIEDEDDDSWAIELVSVSDDDVVALVTDVVAPNVCYTARVDNVALWDPLFVDAFVAMLAHRIAPAVGAGDKAAGFLEEFKEIVAPVAKRADAREKAKSKQGAQIGAWSAARFGIRRPR